MTTNKHTSRTESLGLSPRLASPRLGSLTAIGASLRARRRRLSRRSREGMTLVEIMIVVIIMALITAAVGFAVLPRLQEARIQQAETDALAVRSGVEMYLMNDPTADCPSMSDLTEERILSSSTRTEDPWGNEFEIECDGDEISVHSMGPDGESGTEDDI